MAVAFSGGVDSLALLHATCRAAAALGVRVVALHVHHNLLPEADAWLRSAQSLCRRWARRGAPLALRWTRLDGAPARGQSVEAWARAGRYAALQRMAGEAGASLLLLGQHRRDQAETVLLQLLRGGGPAGLAAMPRTVSRDGLVWARPWLAQPRAAIEAYVRQHRLKPLHDPSNADPALARARLRGRVWPGLIAAFDDAEVALATAAERAGEAAALLAEVAAQDLAALALHDDPAALDVNAWLSLSPPRRANALRAWLRGPCGVTPTDALVRRLLKELPRNAASEWPAGDGQRLRCRRGRLTLVAVAQPEPEATYPADGALLDLSALGRHRLPGWPGWLEVAPTPQHGILRDQLTAVSVRPRQGGERFALAPRGTPRSLKKQYQARGLDDSQRGGPLLYAADGRLLFAPGLGLDARWWAEPGSAQVALRWHPDAA